MTTDKGKSTDPIKGPSRADNSVDRPVDGTVGSAQASAAYGGALPGRSVARSNEPSALPPSTNTPRRPGNIEQIPSDSSLQQKAVAIKQDGQDGPTKLIAKGQGALAEQIIQTAFDRGIKVRSDADLTEILDAVDVDSEIPLAALAAVAEILSYIYRSNAAPETSS